MAYSALDISNYLISRTNPEEGGELLSNMKLQKLLYYCQGFYFAKFKKPLFEEPILAWQYGPVVPAVYHEFKHFGANGIPSEDIVNPVSLEEEENAILADVFNFFNQFSAIKLMNMTHSEEPWCSTKISDEISLEKLNNHFEKFLLKESE